MTLPSSIFRMQSTNSTPDFQLGSHDAVDALARNAIAELAPIGQIKVKAASEIAASKAATNTAKKAAAKQIDRAFHTQLAKLSAGLSPISLSLAYADWAMHLAASPGHRMYLAQRAIDLTQRVMSTAVNTAVNTAVQPQSASTTDPESTAEKDRRFTDPAWNAWPFSVMKEGFKVTEEWCNEATKVGGISRHHSDIVNFFTHQGLDALSPSNWPISPEVLNKGKESLGQSWIKGYQSYAKDVMDYQQSRDPSGDQTHKDHKGLNFEVGKDVAITPGKVVFRNHLFELIQYSATTDTVYAEPLLIVPSCIMKYYILDLSPANSMVRYLVAQGYTVFMISWRNPDASDRDMGLQDYLQMGVMDAMAAVKAQTGAARIHTLGYCLGGTFLAMVAAALGGAGATSATAENILRGRNPTSRDTKSDRLPELATVTLLAAQTDFSEPGELGIFIDDDQLNNLREMMARTGFLSGRQMAGSFQFLNSRDLIWSRNTRRYLLGQDEVGNDMMSWNADVTRLPERMHTEYLTSLFQRNELASGHYRVAGIGVALKDIKAPMLVVGTARDHVCPWRSVYKIQLLTDTSTSFILAAGGHNAGIVSEPGHHHRSYQMNSDSDAHSQDWRDPDDWAAAAPVQEGSWWDAMSQWLQKRSGKRVPAVVIPHDVDLGNAPGEYVMVRYAD